MTNIHVEHFSHQYVESRDKHIYRTSLSIVSQSGPRDYTLYFLGRHLQRHSSMHPAWLETQSGCVYLILIAFERK